MDPSDPSHIAKMFMDYMNDDIDEELVRLYFEIQAQEGVVSSSRPRRQRRNIERNREEEHNRLFNDYFSEAPVYTDEQFRRRYRMHKHVFLRIVEALSQHDEYFRMTVDAIGRSSLSPLQKCTVVIRMLAYGGSADSVDDYLRIGETTTLKCVDKFTRGVISIFGAQYLRRPTTEDVERLLQMGEARDFPSMLGSIDCMHWEWKNCPVALKGQYVRGDHGKPTIMLEAVASQDLWIWHAFFGVAGSSNDINVLNQSHVFNDVLQGQALEVNFTVNTKYNMGYYLSDGIYLEWATFVKSIPMPQGDKRKLFAQHQEGERKDIERAFGVLQSRFAIIRNPARSWHLDALKRIIDTCIILHNMIVEDERATYGGNFDYSYDHFGNATAVPDASNIDFQYFLCRRFHVRDKQIHRHLQQDLVEHIWEHFRPKNNHN
ncbi:uncharacterized protein LOC123919682 [Trifolium pratense]|uniref:uncharacterized protein LOC123919682 n=1 Tax=Trifolium pratense TaxID=57577 RepID=UPI001E697FD5|nr:uncharacterized protein LOC123919682 [Trifolium pratense]